MISRSPFSAFTMTSKFSSLPYFFRNKVLNTSSTTFIIVGRSIFSASLKSWKASIRLILAIAHSFRNFGASPKKLKDHLNFCCFNICKQEAVIQDFLLLFFAFFFFDDNSIFHSLG